MIGILVCALTLVPSQDGAVQLSRVFKIGEKAKYSIESHLTIQSRQYGLKTFIPEDLDINYSFTTNVTALKPDGVAEMMYLRPTITEIEGETYNSAPKTKVDKINLNYKVTISGINEILAATDLNKKKTDPKKGKKGDTRSLLQEQEQDDPQGIMIPNLAAFTGEIYRLALFIGSLDSSLDFNPKLALDAVKVGDTWKRTVGFTPQKLQDKSGKSAMQRIDYVYTYRGPMESDGKKILRISAALKVDTNLADYFNQLMEKKPEQTGLKEIKLNLDAKIEFDLDPVSKKTLMAVATSKGGFKVLVTKLKDEPLVESILDGTTTMRLVSDK